MPLDKIPNLDWEVLETYNHDRYNSPEEFQRFKSQIQEHMTGNRTLGYVIELLASQSHDPNSVYQTAYTLLDVIHTQFEVNELNEMAEVRCDRRE